VNGRGDDQHSQHSHHSDADLSGVVIERQLTNYLKGQCRLRCSVEVRRRRRQSCVRSGSRGRRLQVADDDLRSDTRRG
jgi:hypothetical protein